MTQGQRQANFRPDLEGLRGLAILLVLGFHADIPGFAGGFVGVDVFFVLSGYLITGLLLRELEEHGAIGLGNFYARRARRILPAAAFVIVVTVAAAAVMAAPIDLPRFADDAAAAALFVGNIRFAVQSMDYFSATASVSPFLHYWSLGVEEQFYLVWPILLILAARVARPRIGAGIVLSVVLVASLAAALVLTDAAAPWAFYSLPARAWQLALGGLLAALPFERAGRIGCVVLSLGGWLGLAAVVAAGSILIDAGTPYPGLAAIVPTTGAAALVAAGIRRGSPGAILAVPPLRFLGRISYSLYLIHWPILILPAAALPLGMELPIVERIALCGCAIALAWLSWRFVEEPFHRGRRISLPTRRVLSLAGSSIAVTALFAVLVSLTATYLLEEPAQAGTGAATDTPGGSGDLILAGGGTPLPAASTPSGTPGGSGWSGYPAGPGDDGGPDGTPPPGVVPVDPDASIAPGMSSAPGMSAAPAATPAATPVAVPLAGSGPLTSNVRPSLLAAPNDWERLFSDGCELQYAGSVPPSGCVYGDPNGTVTVALVGDSMAGQWFPALNIIATARHWRVVVMIKFACRFEDIRQYSRVLKREYTECEAWLPNVVTRLQQIKPDLTIVSADRSPGVIDPADDNPVQQGAAMARLLADVPGKIAIIPPTPQLPWDVPTCLSQHRSDVTACAAPRGPALSWRYLLEERAAVKALGSRAQVANMTNWVCPGPTCPAVLGGFIAWRDYYHLTATFAASLAPALAAQLPTLTP